MSTEKRHQNVPFETFAFHDSHTFQHESGTRFFSHSRKPTVAVKSVRQSTCKCQSTQCRMCFFRDDCATGSRHSETCCRWCALRHVSQARTLEFRNVSTDILAAPFLAATTPGPQQHFSLGRLMALHGQLKNVSKSTKCAA